MLKPFEYLYFIVAAIDIYADISSNESIHFFSKPLLMVFLFAFYMQATTGSKGRIKTFVATSLVFAWIGDIALMFVPKSLNDSSLMGITKRPDYFLAGLAAFLFAHMMYAIGFASVSDKRKRPVLRTSPWVIIPLIIYMGAFLNALVPAISGDVHTRAFLGPVIIYSAAIATMVAFALNRYGRVNDKSFALVFGGALLFMFSDSIIAINKFIHPFATAGIFIMTLYIAGQYLIVKGAIAQAKA